MISFEVEVSAALHRCGDITKVVEETLNQIDPEHDWSVWVEQKNDYTLKVSIMSVN